MRNADLTTRSNAKVNLFLEVLHKRGDGYHEIRTLMHEIDFADRLSCVPRGDGLITLEVDHPLLSGESGNTVLAAARLLARECGAREGIHFRLEKTIPPGSGLGGGSSNAVAALRLADRVWNTCLTDDELTELAARIGSDAPFFVRGGLSLAEGRGEALTRMDMPAPAFPITLFLTNIHSPTARAYAGLILPEAGAARSHSGCLAALRAGDAAAVDAAAFNRFRKTVLADLPALGDLSRFLAAATGLSIHLTGSGSALWAVGPAGPVLERLEREPAFHEMRKTLELRVMETHFASPEGR